VAAFTIVELLMVVATIALLVSILLPSLARARELAKRATCANNLREIGRGALSFSREGSLHRGSNSSLGDLPSANPQADNWGDPNAGNMAGMWLLIDNNYCVEKTFLCPSQVNARGDQVADWSDTDTFPTRRFYIEPYHTNSYSYISTVEYDGVDRPSTHGSPSRLVIVADLNPRLLQGRSEVPGDGENTNPAAHGGDGANVARMSGDVFWHTVGNDPAGQDVSDLTLDLDRIYHADPDPNDPDASDLEADGRRASEDDTYLIP
jgi:type II secretory pathway pseudopilin PulG